MQWSEIRQHFPRQWLLIEALEAHSAEGQRILDDIAVIQSFPDSVAAMEGYKQLHRKDPHRELFVVHTDRDRLDIGEIRWFGIRTAEVTKRLNELFADAELAEEQAREASEWEKVGTDWSDERW